jgi:hypothetical protein
MRVDEVDTLIEQLEDFVKAIIRNDKSDSEVEYLILSNMRTSLKEYICQLLKVQTAEPEEYKCPDCGSAMIQRKNKQSGNIFYGCKKFPECKGTRDENGLSKAERDEKKNRDESYPQQDGFAFKRQPWNESGPS